MSHLANIFRSCEERDLGLFLWLISLNGSSKGLQVPDILLGVRTAERQHPFARLSVLKFVLHYHHTGTDSYVVGATLGVTGRPYHRLGILHYGAQTAHHIRCLDL